MLRHARLTAGEISQRFTISRPAISRHLRVLRECGLVRDEPVGRQRLYELDPQRFEQLAAWLAQFEQPSVWAQRLDALGTEVHRTRRERARQDRPDQGRGSHTTDPRAAHPEEDSA